MDRFLKNQININININKLGGCELGGVSGGARWRGRGRGVVRWWREEARVVATGRGDGDARWLVTRGGWERSASGGWAKPRGGWTRRRSGGWARWHGGGVRWRGGGVRWSGSVARRLC